MAAAVGGNANQCSTTAGPACATGSDPGGDSGNATGGTNTDSGNGPIVIPIQVPIAGNGGNADGAQ